MRHQGALTRLSNSLVWSWLNREEWRSDGKTICSDLMLSSVVKRLSCAPQMPRSNLSGLDSTRVPNCLISKRSVTQLSLQLFTHISQQLGWGVKLPFLLMQAQNSVLLLCICWIRHDCVFWTPCWKVNKRMSSLAKINYSWLGLQHPVSNSWIWLQCWQGFEKMEWIRNMMRCRSALACAAQTTDKWRNWDVRWHMDKNHASDTMMEGI